MCLRMRTGLRVFRRWSIDAHVSNNAVGGGPIPAPGHLSPRACMTNSTLVLPASAAEPHLRYQPRKAARRE